MALVLKFYREDVVSMAQNKTETQLVPKKIFVSSTYEDMIPYRNKAMEALRQLQQTPIAMEDFEANNEPSIEVCRNKIEQSDIFLLIVGFKYGSILEEGKSFVELEYEHAIRLKKPILAFIVSDNAEVRVSLVDKGDPAERLDAFKKKLKTNHNVKLLKQLIHYMVIFCRLLNRKLRLLAIKRNTLFWREKRH